jgi:hypothetical protein
MPGPPDFINTLVEKKILMVNNFCLIYHLEKAKKVQP